jgi:DNA-binding NarL/FixJ family response regulator
MDKPRIRVFIVDDHPLVREGLGNLLRLEPDMEVIGDAEDPATALEAIAAAPPDVAVVDLSFKRGSGLQLIGELRSRVPSVMVVVLSMHEEVTDLERALRAGAVGFVMKRESTRHIVEAIRNVREGTIYANPAMLAQLTARFIGRPNDGPATPTDVLSNRELEVFRRLGAGDGTREIADRLGVSLKTIQTYCARIKEKLALADGQELTRAAYKWHAKITGSPD